MLPPKSDKLNINRRQLLRAQREIMHKNKLSSQRKLAHNMDINRYYSDICAWWPPMHSFRGQREQPPKNLAQCTFLDTFQTSADAQGDTFKHCYSDSCISLYLDNKILCYFCGKHVYFANAKSWQWQNKCLPVGKKSCLWKHSLTGFFNQIKESVLP